MSQENTSYKSSLMSELTKKYQILKQKQKLEKGLENLVDIKYFNRNESFKNLSPSKLILEGGFLLNEALYINRLTNGNLPYPTDEQIDQIFTKFKELQVDDINQPIPMIKIPFLNNNNLDSNKPLTILVIGQERIGKKAFIANFINVIANIKIQSLFVYEIDQQRDKRIEFIIRIDQPISGSSMNITEYKLVYFPSIGNFSVDSHTFIEIIKYTKENSVHAIYLIDSASNNRLTKTQQYIQQRIFEVIPLELINRVFLIFTNSQENEFEPKLYLENQALPQELKERLKGQGSRADQNLKAEEQFSPGSVNTNSISIVDDDKLQCVFTFNNMVILNGSENIQQRYLTEIQNENRLVEQQQMDQQEEEQQQMNQQQEQQQQQMDQQQEQQLKKQQIKSSFTNNQKKMFQLLERTKELYKVKPIITLSEKSQMIEEYVLKYIEQFNEQQKLSKKIGKLESKINTIILSYPFNYYNKIQATFPCYKLEQIKSRTRGIICSKCNQLCHSSCRMNIGKDVDEQCSKMSKDSCQTCINKRQSQCSYGDHRVILSYERRQEYNKIDQRQQEQQKKLIEEIEKQKEVKLQKMMIQKKMKSIQDSNTKLKEEIKKILNDKQQPGCIPIDLKKRQEILEEINKQNIANDSNDKFIPQLNIVYNQLIQDLGIDNIIDNQIPDHNNIEDQSPMRNSVIMQDECQRLIRRGSNEQ